MADEWFGLTLICTCRAILNIAAVEDRLRSHYPNAQVQIYYAEDMKQRPLRQQAHAVATASIFIIMHGAGLANFLFLPEVKTIIQ